MLPTEPPSKVGLRWQHESDCLGTAVDRAGAPAGTGHAGHPGPLRFVTEPAGIQRIVKLMFSHIHLVQMLFYSPTTHTALSWTNEADGQLEDMGDFGCSQNIAPTLESAVLRQAAASGAHFDNNDHIRIVGACI